MELLKNWAMTMSAVLVLGSLCEVLLPEGSFQKYVRLSVGMVLVICLVSPLKGCKEETPEGMHFSVDSAQVREQAEDAQRDDVLTLYRENLEKKMLQNLRSSYSEDVSKVQCQIEETDQETFGSIRKVTVEIDSAKTESVTELISQLLKQNFGVDPSRISVRFLKE